MNINEASSCLMFRITNVEKYNTMKKYYQNRIN